MNGQDAMSNMNADDPNAEINTRFCGIIDRFQEADDIEKLNQIADEYMEIIEDDYIYNIDISIVTNQFLEKLCSLAFTCPDEQLSFSCLQILHYSFIDNENFNIVRIFELQFPFLQTVYKKLYEYNNVEISDFVMHMITTIAGFDENSRNSILEIFNFEVLQDLASKNIITDNEIAYFCNICTMKPLEIEILSKFVYYSLEFLNNYNELSESVQSDFIYVLENSIDHFEQIVQNLDSFKELVLKLVENSKLRARTAIVRLICNLSERNPIFVQLIPLDILCYFSKLKPLNTESRCNFITWILKLIDRNILLSNSSIHFNTEFLEMIADFIMNGQYNLRIESANIIRDIIEFGTNQNILYFVQNGLFENLTELLESDDSKFIIQILEIIEHLNRFGHKFEINRESFDPLRPYLEILANYPDLKVSELAVHIYQQIYSNQ